MMPMTSIIEFRGDDAGYLAWLAAHPESYVINVARSGNAAEARVHQSGCRTISGQNPRGGPWTGPYVKVCADHLAELEQWAIEAVGQAVSPCGTCRPTSGSPLLPGPDVSTAVACSDLGVRTEASVAADHFTLRGPGTRDADVFEAWADAYVRFERRHRPDWQQRLVADIKIGCRQLAPAAGQVLHATFFGEKRPDADVENIVLYGIDSFAVAGRNGIRFEHGAAVPPAPDGAEYPFCYRYSLAQREGGFAEWRQGRTLARFGWTELGAFAGEKLAAQVWLALRRSEVEVFEPGHVPGAPFAVKIELQPPRKHQRGVGNLVKGTFDGVISAFQAHGNPSVVPEVSARLAAVLPAAPTEIQQYLLDERRAVLGRTARLVDLYREGVQWNPTDHLCVAGELLLAESAGLGWAIRGEVVELSR